jgi:hypothetical protein
MPLGVIIAADGEEAIAYGLHIPFDLILLDLCMPKVDGIRVIKELRTSPVAQSTPIIVVVRRRRGSSSCPPAANPCTPRRSLPVRISPLRSLASRTSCVTSTGKAGTAPAQEVQELIL